MVHRVGDNPVLDATDAGREGAVIGIDAEFGFSVVEVLLNAFRILVSPFVGLAITYEIIIFETR